MIFLFLHVICCSTVISLVYVDSVQFLYHGRTVVERMHFNSGVISVSPTGSNFSGCGASVSTACLTIAYACKQRTSPREVLLEAGSYIEMAGVTVRENENLTVAGRISADCRFKDKH